MEPSEAPWQPLEPPWQPLGAPLVALRPSRWDLTCDLLATYSQLTRLGPEKATLFLAFSSFSRPSIFDQSFDVILDRFRVPKRVQNGSKIDFEIGALIVRRSEYFLEGT